MNTCFNCLDDFEKQFTEWTTKGYICEKCAENTHDSCDCGDC